MSAHQIDEKNLERVIRKIKHCMALAQSANENEAATALWQAQALMREHRLTDMDVKLSNVGEVESALFRAKRRPAWDQQLSIAVAEAFSCTTLRRRRWSGSEDKIIECATFVGISPAQNIALYAYEALTQSSLKRARSTALLSDLEFIAVSIRQKLRVITLHWHGFGRSSRS